MQCEELVAYLSDYIDHNLDEELIAEAEEHLRTCHNCRVVLDSTQQSILLYREQFRQKQRIPPERSQALYDRLAAALAGRPEADTPDP